MDAARHRSDTHLSLAVYNLSLPYWYTYHMDLPHFVRPYPKFVQSIIKFNGNSIYPWIFLRNEIYVDLLTTQPNPKHIATLEHELAPVRRMV